MSVYPKSHHLLEIHIKPTWSILEQKNQSNQYKLAIILMENRIKPNHLRLLFYFILSLSIHLGLVNQIDVIDFAFHQTKLNISQSKNKPI